MPRFKIAGITYTFERLSRICDMNSCFTANLSYYEKPDSPEPQNMVFFVDAIF